MNAEVLAFECRIVHGNHNNAMLIDRVAERAAYALTALKYEIMAMMRDAAPSSLRQDSCMIGSWK